MEIIEGSRRPLKTRQRGWAQWLAAALNSYGISPNVISVLSLLFAAAASTSFMMLRRRDGAVRIALLLGAAAGIQLRLLCNLLDGLVAVEGGRRTATGELFNEVPDRIADVILLVAAGYAAGGCMGTPEIGWIAALLAVLTAYVRVLGGSLGLRQSFAGPMAKPHRMAVLTVACLLSCFESRLGLRGQEMAAAIWVVAIGAAITLYVRVDTIAQQLRAR